MLRRCSIPSAIRDSLCAAPSAINANLSTVIGKVENPEVRVATGLSDIDDEWEI